MNDHRPTPWYLYLAFLVTPFFGSIWLFRPDRREGSVWLRVLFSLAFEAGLALASLHSEPLGKRIVKGVLYGIGILGVALILTCLVLAYAGWTQLCG